MNLSLKINWDIILAQYPEEVAYFYEWLHTYQDQEKMCFPVYKDHFNYTPGWYKFSIILLFGAERGWGEYSIDIFNEQQCKQLILDIFESERRCKHEGYKNST